MLVVWYFLDENNKVHFVSAEGSIDDIFKITGYVENTYTLNQ